jgi:prepilin-type N-terminal cleavage/methylation domain-containing protein
MNLVKGPQITSPQCSRRQLRRGFTLVEILVVLAILIILFGMLFAPMMAGLDMATSGRAQANMQDTARMVAEQMRRELADAMYVYPLPTIMTGADSAVTDYSQILFVPPASDPDSGEVLSPRQPRFDPVSGETIVTRYFVKPPDLSNDREYDETNPFVLVRQEGLYRYNSTSGQYEFGSIDPDSSDFVVGLPLTENALTPRENYDLPATTTICGDDACRQMVVGYVSVCPGCGGTDLHYLHRNVQFVPERVTGEALAAQQDNTVYVARYGSWMGQPNNGTVELSGGGLPMAEAELQPRLVVYRWNDTSQTYTDIALDSFSSIRSNIRLRWNSAAGKVLMGAWHTVAVEVQLNHAPGAADGTYWPVKIGDDEYDSSGSLSGGMVTAPLRPIYPQAPTRWGMPRMPVAFRIEPGLSDGNSSVAAKIVPESTRVTVVAGGSGDFQRAQYTRVQTIDQSALGTHQYGEYFDSDQRGGEVRFNLMSPPSPDQFGSLDSMTIYVSYYYRRNFDPVSNRDDVVYGDYSTGEVINLTIIPQRFVELESYSSTGDNLVVPADLPLGGVPVRMQAVVRNASR